MTTAKLALPELSVSQAGKEITHNQALAILDQLTQAVVIDKDLSTPPGSPTNGAAYIVAASATGAWAGKSGQIAYWLTSVGAWTFVVPAEGWMVWVTDEALRYERRSGAWSISKARELLFSSRYYYVRTDGNDSNNGLSDTAGGAFLTIQHAVDTVSSLDIGIFNVSINIGDGSYNVGRGVRLKSLVGSGDVTIKGSGATQVFSSGSLLPTEAVFFAGGITGSWRVTDLSVYSTGSGSSRVGIQASAGSKLNVGTIDYGPGFTAQVRAIDSGVLELDSNYSISDGSDTQISSVGAACVRVQNITVTLIGTPAFASFCSANQCGVIIATGNTFIGGSAGQRYFASLNGVINSGGAGASYFPGDVAGTTSTGGQYV